MQKVIDDIILAASDLVLRRKHRRLIRWHRRVCGLAPHIAVPRRYSDRMLWRKMVDHNPLFVTFSDKLACKEYSRTQCPDLPLPRTLWSGQSSDDIPAEMLAGDVYVKANHGSDFNLRTRGGNIDRAKLRELTSGWLASRYGVKTYEWAYSAVKPALFVEEAVGDATAGLLEIQIRASNGRIIGGSFIGNHKTPQQWVIYLDTQGKPARPYTAKDDEPIPAVPMERDIQMPYHEAMRYTAVLSRGVDYARFDFMWNGTTLYGGEITVYPAAGWPEFGNRESRQLFVQGWDLSQAHFLRSKQAGWRNFYAGALRRKLKQLRAMGDPIPA